MKIIVLGHKGMLGNIVYQYFLDKDYQVITTDIKFLPSNYQEWSNFILSYPDAVIINCIGKIKQKTDDISDLLWGNAILPLQLKNILSDYNFLIHPSTDCVFSGQTNSPYPKDFPSDANDDYGWSKRLGEVALEGFDKSVIVRVSIIGLEVSEKKSGLLAWFLDRSSDETLNGFTNHYWNGITTLEWCKQIESIILEKENYGGKLIQLGTTALHSKHEILMMFKKVFERDNQINPLKTEQTVFRCLKPDIICKDLLLQLVDIKEYYNIPN